MVTLSSPAADEWRVLRRLRLAALRDSPDAFMSAVDEEARLPSRVWRERTADGWLVASLDATPVGLLRLTSPPEGFPGDCWISGWWVDPERRGRGVARAVLAAVDERAARQGRATQALGVWSDNLAAVTAFGRLGFVAEDDVRRSERFDGREWLLMLRRTGAAPTGTPS